MNEVDKRLLHTLACRRRHGHRVSHAIRRGHALASVTGRVAHARKRTRERSRVHERARQTLMLHAPVRTGLAAALDVVQAALQAVLLRFVARCRIARRILIRPQAHQNRLRAVAATVGSDARREPCTSLNAKDEGRVEVGLRTLMFFISSKIRATVHSAGCCRKCPGRDRDDSRCVGRT